MKSLLAMLSLLVSNMIGFVVAFTKTFLLNLKDKVDHSGYKLNVIGKVKKVATGAKAWLYAFLSSLQHSPTYC